MELEEILKALKLMGDDQRTMILENLGSKKIDDLLNKIRAEEKSKLQSDLNKQKNMVAELKKQIEQSASAPAPSGDSGIEATLNAALEKSRQESQLLAQQMQQLTTDFTNALKEQELKTVRAEVLAEYGDEIIPEMISGSTPSEIQQSAQAANLTYKRLKSQFTADQQQVSPAQGQQPAAGNQEGLQNPLANVLSQEQLQILQQAQQLANNVLAGQGQNQLGQPPVQQQGQTSGIIEAQQALKQNQAQQPVAPQQQNPMQQTEYAQQIANLQGVNPSAQQLLDQQSDPNALMRELKNRKTALNNHQNLKEKVQQQYAAGIFGS